MLDSGNCADSACVNLSSSIACELDLRGITPERFADLPFDLSDASVAEAAARLKLRHLISIDTDFAVCRARAGAGKPLVNLLRR